MENLELLEQVTLDHIEDVQALHEEVKELLALNDQLRGK